MRNIKESKFWDFEEYQKELKNALNNNNYSLAKKILEDMSNDFPEEQTT